MEVGIITTVRRAKNRLEHLGQLPPFLQLPGPGAGECGAQRGGEGAPRVRHRLFTRDAVMAIHQQSKGIPRVISAIAVGNEVARMTGADDRIQVLWANAAVYWYANRIPATRYLWYRNIERIPGGRQHVVDAFTGSAPPVVAVGYQPVDALDAGCTGSQRARRRRG